MTWQHLAGFYLSYCLPRWWEDDHTPVHMYSCWSTGQDWRESPAICNDHQEAFLQQERAVYSQGSIQPHPEIPSCSGAVHWFQALFHHWIYQEQPSWCLRTGTALEYHQKCLQKLLVGNTTCMYTWSESSWPFPLQASSFVMKWRLI